MAISGNLSCFSGQDLRDEISAGRLEWSAGDPGTALLPNNKDVTFAKYLSYVNNNGALASSSYLITYAEAIANRVLGGGTPPPPTNLHTYSISYPGAITGATYMSGGSGVGGASGGPYSHEFWMKRVGSGVKQTVIHRRAPGSKDGWAFGPGTDNAFKLWVLNTNIVTEYNFGVTSTGAWEHISIQTTINGGVATQSLVHNGSTLASVSALIPSSGEVYLAHMPDNSDLDDYKGLLDHLRIFSNARAAATIAGDMSSLTPGSGCVADYRFEEYSGTEPKIFPSSTGTPGNLYVVDASISTDYPF